jgi:transposase
MNQLHLTSRQRHLLQRQLIQTRDVGVYRRTLAILESDRGRSVADIARMLGVSRQSIYNWLETFQYSKQPSALEEQGGRGRHRRLDEDDEHLLIALLALSPQDLDYPNTSWTIPLLQEVFEICTDQCLSDDTLRRALHRLDYAWKRPRYRLEPDPEREKKTTHSPANPGSACSQRRAGPGRNRFAALSTASRRLVETR